MVQGRRREEDALLLYAHVADQVYRESPDRVVGPVAEAEILSIAQTVGISGARRFGQTTERFRMGLAEPGHVRERLRKSPVRTSFGPGASSRDLNSCRERDQRPSQAEGLVARVVAQAVRAEAALMRQRLQVELHG